MFFETQELAGYGRDKDETTALKPTREVLKQMTGTNMATMNLTACPENKCLLQLDVLLMNGVMMVTDGSWFLSSPPITKWCSMSDLRHPDSWWSLPLRMPFSSPRKVLCAPLTAPLNALLRLPLLQLKPQTHSTWVNLS